MAMATAVVVATPRFHLRVTATATLRPPPTETLMRNRNTTDDKSRGHFQHRRLSDFSTCRGGPSEPPAAPTGLSSSGRDGGASCSIGFSRASSSHNAAGLGWRACSGGLFRSDGSRLASAVRRQSSNRAAVPRRLPLQIAAEKPDLTNVVGTIVRIGKQGLEAGTKLVPESVPRPVAQAGVGLGGVLLASFLLKSLFSTVTFILAIGALSYFAYFFLTKGESSSSAGKGGDGSSGKPKSTDEALEEARRIMEKYK